MEENEEGVVTPSAFFPRPHGDLNPGSKLRRLASYPG